MGERRRLSGVISNPDFTFITMAETSFMMLRLDPAIAAKTSCGWPVNAAVAGTAARVSCDSLAELDIASPSEKSVMCVIFAFWELRQTSLNAFQPPRIPYAAGLALYAMINCWL